MSEVEQANAVFKKYANAHQAMHESFGELRNLYSNALYNQDNATRALSGTISRLESQLDEKEKRIQELERELAEVKGLEWRIQNS